MDENPVDQPIRSTSPGPDAPGASGPDRGGPSPEGERLTLRRSSSQRVFGGVAGGVAERFDIDANVVRVIFVVLALVYGLGVALYLAMWALIPRSKTEPVEPPPDEGERRRVRWLRFALPMAFVVLALVVLAALHHAARWGRGLSLLWLVFLVVLAAAALNSPARRLTLRRFLALCFLVVVSFWILAVGAFLVLVQVTGVPLRGGSGVHVWHPDDQAQVLSTYRGSFGESTINLSSVRFGPGSWTLTASETVGQLNVYLPSDVSIDLVTHVGVGNVVNTDYVTAPSPSRPPATPAHLVLNLQVGVGEINLVHPVTPG